MQRVCNRPPYPHTEPSRTIGVPRDRNSYTRKLSWNSPSGAPERQKKKKKFTPADSLVNTRASSQRAGACHAGRSVKQAALRFLGTTRRPRTGFTRRKKEKKKGGDMPDIYLHVVQETRQVRYSSPLFAQSGKRHSTARACSTRLSRE